MGGGKAADSRTNNNQVVDVRVWLRDATPVALAFPGKCMADFKRAVVIATHSG